MTDLDPCRNDDRPVRVGSEPSSKVEADIEVILAG